MLSAGNLCALNSARTESLKPEHLGLLSQNGRVAGLHMNEKFSPLIKAAPSLVAALL